ncbi:Cytochrome c7 c [uncultured archaeon]|nr:Cytochrome c7 c [uncultured archaeon]
MRNLWGVLESDVSLAKYSKFCAILTFILLSGVAAASPFAVPAIGNPQINLTTNRLVILDDPSGWDGGNATIPITDRGNQWSGESTTIRWYALLINSSGRAARNITVTSQLLFPNGTVALEKTGITNSFGIAAFDQDMDRWLRFNGSASEGMYTINSSATVDNTSVAGSYNFIYDEWGCGSSGSGCHKSQYWQGGFMDSQIASTFATGSIQNSPYLHAWDNFHNISSHGFGGGFIGNGECLTCHRGYDSIYRNHSSRVQATSQYPAGVHNGKVPCTGCHAAFNSGTMPIRQCYDCHPLKNNNLTIKTFTQAASSGFSYQPLTDTNITAHNAGMNIPCIICHNGMHNVSKPYNAADTSNTFTEYQQCTACHSARKRHNDSVSCTVCHSQDAHAIKVFAQNATYIQGVESGDRGNCTSCHQNSSFLSTLLSQPKAGSHTGSAPQVPDPLNHSNDPIAGMKWNQTPGYWMNGTNGSARLSSCKYCHGDTLHKTAALGRPSLWEGNNTVNSTLDGTSWCASCHWQGYARGANTYNDTVSTFTGDNLSVPPEITGNATYGANQSAPAYFNHSNITKDDVTCKGCHGRLATGVSITGFMHNVAVGSAAGGPDCALCHDINGIAPKRINFSAFKEGVHRNLNSAATNNTTLSEIVDKACWACHGEGNEPAGHPSRYKTPRRCSNNDCHSLNQSFKAPMVYSHFEDAALNGNPDNTTNFNISTKAPCETCHSNSLIEVGENLNASVSHYASTGDLIGSRNCIYCHLDKDNSEKWGNATEINKNRTSMTELDKLNNKFTAREGEFTELGMGYRIKVTGISTKRGSADMELYKADTLVDKGLVNIGEYVYEEYRIVDNATTRIPVIKLNITGMFASDNESFIQFDGTRIKRLHYENKTTSCYLCHFNGDAMRRKYTVIDRRDDNLFYTEVFFNSSDRNEFYQEQALQLLANMTPADAHSDIDRSRRMTLREGDKWELAGNYSLTLEDISNKSASARFLLQAGGNYTEIVERGNTFVYEPDIELGIEHKNMTLFRAKVAEIQEGTPGIVVLEDILALSPDIKEIKDNTTISGYNTSWLWENHTFLTGRIPTNMHVPLLQQGRDGGPDCVSCHNVGDLGAHTGVNFEAASNVAAVNKPCWACHGTGQQPRWHPATYREPRDCKSCHVEQQVPFFNATYIGDEKHANQTNCRSCHISNTHKLLRFDVVPAVKDLSLSRKEVVAGEKITINATAIAGYLMRVRAAEYYIDSPARVFPMAATDGSFDDQTEEITATLDTSGLAPGNHTAYVRAMERNNKWGTEEAITFVVQGTGGESRAAVLPALAVSLFLAVVIFRMRRG